MARTRGHLLALWTAVLLGIGTGASARDDGPELQRLVSALHSERSATVVVVDQSGMPGAEQVQYGAEDIDGIVYQIGTAKGLEVRIALIKGQSLEARIYVLNASGDSVTFRPREIRAEAERRGKTVPLRTFSAREWERKQRAEAAVGSGESSTPLSTSAGDQGESEQQVYFSQACSGTLQGSGSGAGVRPTRQDCSEAYSQPITQGSAASGRPGASPASARPALAREHTLDPDSYYVGVVHIKKKKADQYRVTVPFGGETFSFDFQLH